MTLVQLAEFFRIMTLVNIGLLALIVVVCITTKKLMYRLHGRLFDISQENIAITLYNFLGNFKMLVIVFNLVPYIALTLMR